MKSIALLNFYFGKFPNYFPLFLSSCAINPDITWMIYTDNIKKGEWPSNVIYKHITFDKCKELFQSKFDFTISLDSPKKLCDYKVAYGYILKEELSNYDYWGYCDLDVIYGNVRKFIDEDILNKNDKIYSLGHFTLYCNDDDVNQVFLSRAKEVYTEKNMLGYDEWGNGNINDLFLKSNHKFYSGTLGADIWPVKFNFYLSEINFVDNRYHIVSKEPCIFIKNEYGLFLYNRNERIEYPYVHLQKRTMSLKCVDANEYYIIPNQFVDGISLEEAYQLGSKKRVIDPQYIKVKMINIKNRLKRML